MNCCVENECSDKPRIELALTIYHTSPANLSHSFVSNATCCPSVWLGIVLFEDYMQACLRTDVLNSQRTNAKVAAVNLTLW